MNRKVYFGNAVMQFWIPAPQSGLTASNTGFSTTAQLLSGRAFTKRSVASHRGFDAAWVGPLNSEVSEDSLHTIKDYSDGIYGNGPFYWLDPYATKTNLLAPHWAAPMLTEKDWPTICAIPSGSGATSFVPTESNTKSYPYKSLNINLESTDSFESANANRVIIPTAHRFHFGWHGDVISGDATVILRAYSRSTGLPTDITTSPLSVNSAIRTNTQVSGTTYSMVDVIVVKPAGATSEIRIAGMIAQVRGEVEAVPQGDFISGRGTTSIEFSSLPQIEYYSANVNNGQISLTASFTEV
jgi:hypothetical protein